jgi:hypothetical protein
LLLAALIVWPDLIPIFLSMGVVAYWLSQRKPRPEKWTWLDRTWERRGFWFWVFYAGLIVAYSGLLWLLARQVWHMIDTGSFDPPKRESRNVATWAHEPISFTYYVLMLILAGLGPLILLLLVLHAPFTKEWWKPTLRQQRAKRPPLDNAIRRPFRP